MPFFLVEGSHDNATLDISNSFSQDAVSWRLQGILIIDFPTFSEILHVPCLYPKSDKKSLVVADKDVKRVLSV